jgi:nucleotide-binding universal stress UspA family protein
MQKTIMVPLDGSGFSEQALPMAVALARRLDGRLHLVLVRASLPLVAGSTPEDEYLHGVKLRLEADLPGEVSHRVLVDEMGALAQPPPPAKLVATLLAQHAGEEDATLIVMTTHGHGGLRRAWLGSVTDALVRLAPRSVLLIRPTDDTGRDAERAARGIRHVLVPLDGSDAAEEIRPYALLLGAAFGARYTLLRTVSPLTWEATADMYVSYPATELTTLNRQAAVEDLERSAAHWREEGAAVETAVVTAMSPAPAILEYAGAHDADLIALCTTGAGRARRLLLGSVADKLVRGAEAPVLVCNVRRLERHDAVDATRNPARASAPHVDAASAR